MFRLKVWFVFGLAAVLLGCAPTAKQYIASPKGVLAIAPCFHPNSPWEMLAGKADLDQNIDPKHLRVLDAILARTLVEDKVEFIPAQVVKPCLLLTPKKPWQNMLDYWVKVGQCVPADFLLIPYIYVYKQRIGSDYGVTQPAQVEFDLFLLNVKQKQIDYRFHFKERQVSLSENLLTLGKFLKHKAKWVTAKELFQEGLNQGLKEMGL